MKQPKVEPDPEIARQREQAERESVKTIRESTAKTTALNERLYGARAALGGPASGLFS